MFVLMWLMFYQGSPKLELSSLASLLCQRLSSGSQSCEGRGHVTFSLGANCLSLSICPVSPIPLVTVGGRKEYSLSEVIWHYPFMPLVFIKPPLHVWYAGLACASRNRWRMGPTISTCKANSTERSIH